MGIFFAVFDMLKFESLRAEKHTESRVQQIGRLRVKWTIQLSLVLFGEKSY